MHACTPSAIAQPIGGDAGKFLSLLPACLPACLPCGLLDVHAYPNVLRGVRCLLPLFVACSNWFSQRLSSLPWYVGHLLVRRRAQEYMHTCVRSQTMCTYV